MVDIWNLKYQAKIYSFNVSRHLKYPSSRKQYFEQGWYMYNNVPYSYDKLKRNTASVKNHTGSFVTMNHMYTKETKFTSGNQPTSPFIKLLTDNTNTSKIFISHKEQTINHKPVQHVQRRGRGD